MKPTIQLAEVRTRGGKRLALYAHDGEFTILVDGHELMHSCATASESLMGTRIGEHFPDHASPRYLIGGLGLGFTLRAVLDHLPPDGRVAVAELLPEVVVWNRSFMRDLNGLCLEDPRVSVFEGDVAQLLNGSDSDHWDGIMLDVDNGPTAMVQTENNRLYDRGGIECVKRVLRPGGRVIYWSASPDKGFEQRLRKAGFKVEAVPAKAYAQAKRPSYMLYLADLPGAGG